MMNWEACSAVERRQGKVSGAWVFAGTRVPVASLYENLARGATVEQFLDCLPGVEERQVEGGSRLRGGDAEGFRAAVRLLFDQGTPVPLRRHLVGHSADTAADRGWSDLDNGELIENAEQEGYDVLNTTDQNIRHQQNLRGRRLTIAVPLSTAWSDVRLRTEAIRAAELDMRPGDVQDVPI